MNREENGVRISEKGDKKLWMWKGLSAIKYAEIIYASLWKHTQALYWVSTKVRRHTEKDVKDRSDIKEARQSVILGGTVVGKNGTMEANTGTEESARSVYMTGMEDFKTGRCCV